MNHLIFFFLSAVFLVSCSSSTASKKQTGLDAHMHIHSMDSEDDMEFTGGRALLAADSIGLNKAIILSHAYGSKVTQVYARKQNDYIIAEMKKKPSQLAGACAINPMTSWAADEVERCFREGIKVIKLHTMASGMDLKNTVHLKKLSEILKRIEEKKLTVLIHGNLPERVRGNEAEILLGELEKYPGIKLILGHLLGREFRSLRDFKHPNFWVEVSAAPIMIKDPSERQKIVKVMRDVGMKHFIFGSDWPVFHPAETLKALSSFPLTEKELNAVVYENGEQLNYLFN